MIERSNIDYDQLYLITSYLTLKEKLKLSYVSKKFSDCVNQSIRCEKQLEIKVTFGSNHFDKSRSVDIIVEEEICEDLPLRELNFNNN
jgi:hypothetical protein